MFWYNKAFFDENGYTLPTTWEEYGDLAVKIAAEHPGKISGFLGDAYAVNRYLRASGCPTNDRVSETEAHIDLERPDVRPGDRAAHQMYDGGALSTAGHLRRRRGRGRRQPRDEPRSRVVGQLPLPRHLEDPGRAR